MWPERLSRQAPATLGPDESGWVTHGSAPAPKASQPSPCPCCFLTWGIAGPQLLECLTVCYVPFRQLAFIEHLLYAVHSYNTYRAASLC